MKLSHRISARSINLAKRFQIKDGRCKAQFMFDDNHFHIEAVFDTADSVKVSKRSL